MKIKIEGHSGCNVEVVRENGRLLVYKYSTTPETGKRLWKQAAKQSCFLSSPHIHDVNAPAVLRRIDESEKYGMVMEFIHARNFIDFFENSACSAPEVFAEKIIEFLEWEFSRSPLRPVSNEVLVEKFESVKKTIHAVPMFRSDREITSLLEYAEKIFARECERVWPQGVCHGDLTLSNILFRNSTIYLIDFLDSFVETPLMDLVKLRQDTRYGWSLLLCREPFDQVKIKIILSFLDQHLWSHFHNFPGVADGYHELQFMNFLRILQYAREPEIVSFLKDRMARLLAETTI